MTTYLGIDIGKNTIHVCTPDEGPARRWPVTIIDLEAPNWHQNLAALVTPGETIAAIEPTGWHYSRPIIAVLQDLGTSILHVAHHASKATRAANISSQKTDINDARALAVKAVEYATTNQAVGVKVIPPELNDLLISLRLTISALLRTKQLRSRSINRLDAYARGIWPSLSLHRNTWLRAVAVGAICPDELHALAERVKRYPIILKAEERNAYASAKARNSLRKLTADLPIMPVPADLREAIIKNFTHLQEAEEEIARLTETLNSLIQHPLLVDVTRAWQTAPAWSPTELATLHAACNCHAQDFSADEFRAAVGCHPSRQESGQITEAKATKRGYRPAKAALHLWTERLLSPAAPQPNPISEYFYRLKAENKPFAIHSTRGKLARILSGLARAAARGDEPTFG